MLLVFSIFLILSANAEDLSDFTDDYYNGMKDYDMNSGMDSADFLNRLSNMMVRRGKFYDGALSRKASSLPLLSGPNWVKIGSKIGSKLGLKSGPKSGLKRVQHQV